MRSRGRRTSTGHADWASSSSPPSASPRTSAWTAYASAEARPPAPTRIDHRASGFLGHFVGPRSQRARDEMAAQRLSGLPARARPVSSPSRTRSSVSKTCVSSTRARRCCSSDSENSTEPCSAVEAPSMKRARRRQPQQRLLGQEIGDGRHASPFVVRTVRSMPRRSVRGALLAYSRRSSRRLGGLRVRTGRTPHHVQADAERTDSTPR